MPTVIPTEIVISDTVAIILKGVILIILVFYVIFALVVIRQVDLMSRTLITRISPILKATAIFNAGFAIGLIFLAWGLL